MKVLALILVICFLTVGLSLAQEHNQPAFTLNPMTGELQAAALSGYVDAGQVNVAVDGQHVATVSMPNMEIGQTFVLAVVPNPQSVITWQISGAYNYTWGNGGVWQPTPDLSNDPPPNVVIQSTIDTNQAPVQALEPVYHAVTVTIPTLNEAGKRLYAKLFD